jgi:SAM-dependent methyltransferase
MTGSAYWDHEAAAFDEEPDHGLNDPAVRAAWAEFFRDWLPAAPCSVADLGCGTGSLSVLLAEHGHAVTGTDFSVSMLGLAREKAARYGVEADFRVGDAADPMLPEASYDVVLTRHVLWTLPDKEEAVRRWARLLRPGGRFLLIEGRWFTGAGIDSDAVLELLEPHTTDRTLLELGSPALWGREIDDERYAVIGLRS